ncbi:cupin domain-containing protein [Photorhabdus temperata]|uniref:Cupin domain-containing protein n=1 Tax=Photorhabdus temperata subsp. temperata Meg1 TaxID=1393735 RepID=A0A081S2A3_PHOTE|nr:cupin domain-containing protein [Photorhabdus temperata]KER05056.1 cupin domain-containing protein [Photorhabdus temperata subsp. temperata Meg1]MCT8347489.1 cupin domain-containing protein [Photorhabdus temperata]
MNTPVESQVQQTAENVRHTYLPAGAGPKVWMSGDEYHILLDAKGSGGTMTLLDALVPPTSGPPIHSHKDVDELFFVLDGELEIMADGVLHQVKAGGRVFVKQGIPHAFINRTSSPVHMLIFYTPGGIEEFFLAAGQPAINGIAPPAANEESTAREIEIASHHSISQATNTVEYPTP